MKNDRVIINYINGFQCFNNHYIKDFQEILKYQQQKNRRVI